MDHLPAFKYMVEPYPRVPLLSERPYDGLGFDGYAAREGFNPSRFDYRDFSQHPRERMAAFLQTWLFFGSLHEILSLGGKPFDFGQFVSLDDWGFRISTRHLDGLITEWSLKVAELETENAAEYRALLRSVDAILTTLHRVYHNLSLAPDSPVPREVVLSLGILGSTFDHALFYLFGVALDRDWGLATLAATRMMAAGWCPRDIALTRDNFSEIPMLCASYMERRSLDFDHWDCSADTCRLNNIDEATYVTKHTRDGCQCEFFVPDQAEIRRILNKGDIPVINLTSSAKDANGVPILDGMTVETGNMLTRPYVAISHV